MITILFGALAICSIRCKNRILKTKVTAQILGWGNIAKNRSNGVRNVIGGEIRRVVNKEPTVLPEEKKTRVRAPRTEAGSIICRICFLFQPT